MHLRVHIQLVHLFVVLPVVHGFVFAHEGRALGLEVPLALHLVLESLFVGFLTHHPLQFKSVCVVLLNSLHFILILLKSLRSYDEQIAKLSWSQSRDE